MMSVPDPKTFRRVVVLINRSRYYAGDWRNAESFDVEIELGALAEKILHDLHEDWYGIAPALSWGLTQEETKESVCFNGWIQQEETWFVSEIADDLRLEDVLPETYKNCYLSEGAPPDLVEKSVEHPLSEGSTTIFSIPQEVIRRHGLMDVERDYCYSWEML